MKLTNNNIYQEIKELLYSAKNRVYQTINTTMTQTYFQIGKRIVEEEQGGETRAEYGSALLKNLSSELIKEFGKGYSEQNLKNMRQFYLIYQKRQTVSSEFKLSWSHYIFLTRIENINFEKSKFVSCVFENIDFNNLKLIDMECNTCKFIHCKNIDLIKNNINPEIIKDINEVFKDK